jgi:hypothetical protein
MNRKIAAGAAAVVVLTGGGVLAVATSAAAKTSSHTLKVTGKALDTRSLGKNDSDVVAADKLISKGKVVGFSNASCHIGGTGDKCAVTFALKGGIIYGNYTFPITSSGIAPTTAKGKITGGAGTYTGVKGTIKIVATTRSGKITLTYS